MVTALRVMGKTLRDKTQHFQGVDLHALKIMGMDYLPEESQMALALLKKFCASLSAFQVGRAGKTRW